MFIILMFKLKKSVTEAALLQKNQHISVTYTHLLCLLPQRSMVAQFVAITDQLAEKNARHYTTLTPRMY